ncbi:MAG: hypothetical protein RLZ28_1093 [Actinomycetota bacterium]|jgi:hypothetical protein
MNREVFKNVPALLSAAFVALTGVFALLQFPALIANTLVIFDFTGYSLVGAISVLDHLISIMGPAIIVYLALTRLNGKTNLLLILGTFVVGAIVLPLIQVIYSSTLSNQPFAATDSYIAHLQSFTPILPGPVSAVLRFATVGLWLAAIVLSTVGAFVGSKLRSEINR